MKSLNLSKQQKILLVLHNLSGGSQKNLKFEDISVGLFKRFPNDFHMKGYREYPDSGDSIKRPLYTFRDKGLLVVRNMIFSLTDKGLDFAKSISEGISGKTIVEEYNLDRYVDNELKRISSLGSFKLFLDNQHSNIFDTDFFDYLGISVRSSRMDFKGRLKYVGDVIKILKQQDGREYGAVIDFHYFMINKFKREINYKLSN